ncbi:MAG TPA: hypothetical protein VGH96_13495 [Streptosporangiaceae bacterium]
MARIWPSYGPQPAGEDGAADAGRPAPAEGATAGGQAESGATDPDPAVTAEAAGNVLAIAQAAGAGRALAAGDLDAALAALMGAGAGRP